MCACVLNLKEWWYARRKQLFLEPSNPGLEQGEESRPAVYEPLPCIASSCLHLSNPYRVAEPDRPRTMRRFRSETKRIRVAGPRRSRIACMHVTITLDNLEW